MKINANLVSKKQHRKQRENIGSRTLHGSILEGLGKPLSAIGALLGAMLAFLGRSWALLGRLFGLMGASGLIWKGFGRLLGGSDKGFWGGFSQNFGKILGRYLRFRDPRAASPTRLASQYAGVSYPSCVRLLGSGRPMPFGGAQLL